jgi:hypothetical protein
MQLVNSTAGGYHHLAGTCVQDKYEDTKDTVRIYRQVVRRWAQIQYNLIPLTLTLKMELVSSSEFLAFTYTTTQ